MFVIKDSCALAFAPVSAGAAANAAAIAFVCANAFVSFHIDRHDYLANEDA
jgi:hypothetical protein